MAAMNLIVLIGRLTAEPEVRETQNGNQVASFNLAVDRNKAKGQEKADTDFIPVIAWGRLAEICQQLLDKGSMVSIEGRLQTRSYTTNEGQKRKVYEVVASRMQKLDSKKNDLDSGSRPGGSGYDPESLDGIGMEDLGM